MARKSTKTVSGRRERQLNRRMIAAGMFEQGKTRAEVCAELGVSWQSAHAWYKLTTFFVSIGTSQRQFLLHEPGFFHLEQSTRRHRLSTSQYRTSATGKFRITLAVNNLAATRPSGQKIPAGSHRSNSASQASWLKKVGALRRFCFTKLSRSSKSSFATEHW